MKPVALVERAIRNSSKSRDIVLDLFGGSGSTLIAAEKTGRQARLVELDPKYVDVIVPLAGLHRRDGGPRRRRPHLRRAGGGAPGGLMQPRPCRWLPRLGRDGIVGLMPARRTESSTPDLFASAGAKAAPPEARKVAPQAEIAPTSQSSRSVICSPRTCLAR